MSGSKTVAAVARPTPAMSATIGTRSALSGCVIGYAADQARLGNHEDALDDERRRRRPHEARSGCTQVHAGRPAGELDGDDAGEQARPGRGTSAP